MIRGPSSSSSPPSPSPSASSSSSSSSSFSSSSSSLPSSGTSFSSTSSSPPLTFLGSPLHARSPVATLNPRSWSAAAGSGSSTLQGTSGICTTYS
eukprot:4873776-Pyramimonas_sp.AAC.1